MTTKLDLAQQDAEVINLQRAVRTGKRLSDGADTIGYYHDQIVRLEAECRRLQAENARLRRALNDIGSAQQSHRSLTWVQMIERARAALGAE